MNTNDHVERLLDVVGEAFKGRCRLLTPGRTRELQNGAEDLLDAVRELRLEPAELFAAAFGPAQGRGLPEIFLENLERRAPRSVLAGRVDRVLRQPDRGKANPDASPAFRERLAAIDEKRFRFPFEARPLAHALLADVLAQVELGREPVVTLCDALAQTGIIECVLGDYPESAVFLLRGLKLSRQLEDPRREGSLLLRCVTLFTGLGENRLGLMFAERSVRLGVLNHDGVGLGKSLFYRGMLLRRLGDVRGAIESYRGALPYLPPEVWTYRFAVLQSLALALVLNGQVEEARSAADDAEREHRTRDGLNWWKLQWIRGEIALASGALDEAETTFRQARQVFEAEGDDLDVALISLRLAKTLLLAGKTGEMRQVAADLLVLLEPLTEENRLAARIVRELARKALVEEVTVDFLDRAHAEIKASATV